uniref:Uncharacterized protein n=1 Tax=Salix viminalis TaxID=40686 RepID=A0A6N2L3Z7_SALVM
MDTDSIKSAIKNSLMVKYPIFRSLLGRDKKDGNTGKEQISMSIKTSLLKASESEAMPTLVTGRKDDRG